MRLQAKPAPKQKMPTKYPEFDYTRCCGLYASPISFQDGSGACHAYYLREMSYKHPVLYYLFYRWWVPMLLTPDERMVFDERKSDEWERPYWAEFSLHHPVQFMLLIVVCRAFQFFSKGGIKLLTAPVKLIRRLFERQGFGVPDREISGVDSPANVGLKNDACGSGT